MMNEKEISQVQQNLLLAKAKHRRACEELISPVTKSQYSGPHIWIEATLRTSL